MFQNPIKIIEIDNHEKLKKRDNNNNTTICKYLKNIFVITVQKEMK